MLSAGGMHYAQGFGRMSSANMVTHHDHNQAPMSGLDALAQGSQYALQQLHDSHLNPAPQEHDAFSQNQSGQDQAGNKGSSNGAPVRRRISRACDQCNQLRTKCDGKTPCAHCVEFGLTCEYNRERKKRGKASRKDIAAQSQNPGTATSDNGANDSPKSSNEQSAPPENATEIAQNSLKRRRSSNHHIPPPPPRRASMTIPNPQTLAPPPPPQTAQSQQSQPQTQHHLPPLNLNKDAVPGAPNERYSNMRASVDGQNQSNALPAPRPNHSAMPDRNSVGVTNYTGSMDDYHRSVLQQPPSAVAHHPMMPAGSAPLSAPLTYPNGMPFNPESPYAVPSPQSQNNFNTNFRMGESPISAHGLMGTSPHAGSPGWLQLPSPSAALYTNFQQPNNQTLRYPVLKPILSRISAIIPISLACDLLEIYFSSSYSKFIQPASPYVLGIIFRKNSFLRQNNPRACSPALLASMLWVGAQTSESAFLTSPPSARGKVCQKLLELTVSLLRPLIHTPTEGANQAANSVVNGVALGGFGVALHTARHDSEGGSTGAAGALDDVATYINLATVVSASEYKAASLRWWNAAWSLARELKLGRELPPNPDPSLPQDENAIVDGNAENDMGMNGQQGFNSRRFSGMPASMSQPGAVTEEEREERRRAWWLLYIVDRHLALCYNRPLFLLDAECEGLLQPEDESVYQAGEYYTTENMPETYYRRRGPPLECTGHSIFGYFLPLMTILGEIVDLNHTRNHPRFGMRFRNGTDLDDMAHEISLQLDSYGRSLEAFEARFIPADGTNPDGTHVDNASPSNQSTSSNRITETVLLTKTIVAYGTHLMHTLHILLNGKWDPISLLDDNDLWISSQSFVSATGHAVSAADAISGILDYDPDLSFMPFFFGIYLLQGSFLLLLIADKLQGEASASVVKACEQIVRAHEVCVVTLNTEYQRNFRKVMRSALSQVRGRSLEDFGEQQQRRREVLALYRWTGDGSGLAL
ncbi:hypothetical protein D6C95_06176 [Aureobasidium pullulans]|nr:hypothetical protein D6C95_06176 [Aureobasidium pullulans]